MALDELDGTQFDGTAAPLGGRLVAGKFVGAAMLTDETGVEISASNPLDVSAAFPAALLSSYTQDGVIAINTVLLTLDCSQHNGISVQCSSLGTSGIISPEWSNDNVTWVTAAIFTTIGGGTTTITTTGIFQLQAHARYLRLRLSTATTAGTTTLSVYQFAARGQAWYNTQVVSGTVTATVTAGTVNPVTPATPYFVNSAATTNGALVLTGTSNLSAFYATNEGASVAYVKLYNKATAPTVGTDIPEMTFPIPAAADGVPGFFNPNIGFHGFRFALGLGIAITRNAVYTDTTAIGAGEVKVKLSRTV